MKYDLHDSEFLSAKEKALILKQWKRFLTNGLRFGDFTDRLYKHLSLHCMFIAHYSRDGFYSTYFEDPESTIKFLHQFDADYRYRSIEYGMTAWVESPEYSDVNMAMCDILAPLKVDLYASLSTKAREKDVAVAKALLAKHGLTVPQVMGGAD